MGTRVEKALGDGTMEVDAATNGANGVAKKQKYFIGSTEVNVPRENCEIKPYMQDCQIDNWDLFEQMMDFMYNRCLVTDSKNHGILFSEAPVCFRRYESSYLFLVEC